FVSESNKVTYQKKLYFWTLKRGLKFNLLLSIIIIVIVSISNLKVKGSTELLILSSLLPFLMFFYEVQKSFLRGTLQNNRYANFTNLNTLLLVLFNIIGAWLFDAKGIIIGQYI